MKPSRVSLYEFVPYGAPELLEVRETYLTRALFAATIGLVALFLLSIGVAARFVHTLDVPMPPIDKVYFLQPLPPAFEPLRPAARPTHVASDPRNAVIEPVQDEHAIVDPGPLPADTHGSGDTHGVGPVEPSQGSTFGIQPAAPSLGEVVFFDEAPVVVKQVLPDYPEIARDAGLDGWVRLRVLVGLDGRVMDVHVDQANPIFIENAVRAVKQWVFTPALANGHPVMVWVAIPVKFSLH